MTVSSTASGDEPFVRDFFRFSSSLSAGPCLVFFGPPSTKYIFGPSITYHGKTLKFMGQRIEPPTLCRKEMDKD